MFSSLKQQRIRRGFLTQGCLCYQEEEGQPTHTWGESEKGSQKMEFADEDWEQWGRQAEAGKAAEDVCVCSDPCKMPRGVVAAMGTE